MPPRKPSAIGSHVPSGGGLLRAVLPYAREVGAEALQIFVGNPRGWALAAGDPAQDESFRAACAGARLPVFVHAPYLVNFGSPTPATLRRSVDATRHALRRAARMGARGVVFHAGSAVAAARRDEAMRAMRELVLPVLDELEALDPGGVLRLLVEPMAGGPQCLAAGTQDLPGYLAALDSHPRLGICLDTCHLFAAGHDLAAPGGVRTMLSALGKAVPRGALGLVHANDSKDPLGSGRDRHESIGAGLIGANPFAELFRHPTTRGVPVVVETPGDADAHRKDIDLLKSLRDQ